MSKRFGVLEIAGTMLWLLGLSVLLFVLLAIYVQVG